MKFFDKLSNVTISQIILFAVTMCGYMSGVFLHMKIIILSKKEKEMTWKLDMTNSCLIILFCSFNLAVEGIVFIFPDFFVLVGEWSCYTSKFIAHYGNLYIFAHSLIIAALKYIRIVRWKKVLLYGKDKVTETFFWLNSLHPVLLISLQLITRPDFFTSYSGHTTVFRCSEGFNHDWNPDAENGTNTKIFQLCQIEQPSNEQDHLSYAIYVLRKCLCGVLLLNHYLTFFNIYETVLYCEIFRFMRR